MFVQKIKASFLAKLSSVALSVALAVGLLGVAGSASAATVVTDAGQQGWFFQGSNCSIGSVTGSQSFVAGPGTPPLGIGSLQQNVGADGNTRQAFGQMNWNGVPLSAITSLSYSTYVSRSGVGGNQAPYLILNIDSNNSGVVDDQLFFEPGYQSSVFTGLPLQGLVSTGVWQTWDAAHGGWWSAQSTAGATAGVGVKSLAAYLAVKPNARIINNPQDNTGALRIASGCGTSWTGFVGNADNLSIAVSPWTMVNGKATTTIPTGTISSSIFGPVNASYDFDPAPSSATTLACSPSATNAVQGSPVTFSATGGTGTYSWSAPGLTITNAVGSNFTVTYNGVGTNTVTVTSGAQTAECTVNVLSAASVVPPSTTPTPSVPGLPNTGEGGGESGIPALLTVAALGLGLIARFIYVRRSA